MKSGEEIAHFLLPIAQWKRYGRGHWAMGNGHEEDCLFPIADCPMEDGCPCSLDNGQWVIGNNSKGDAEPEAAVGGVVGVELVEGLAEGAEGGEAVGAGVGGGEVMEVDGFDGVDVEPAEAGGVGAVVGFEIGRAHV